MEGSSTAAPLSSLLEDLNRTPAAASRSSSSSSDDDEDDDPDESSDSWFVSSTFNFAAAAAEARFLFFIGFALFRDEINSQDDCNADILIEQADKDDNPHKRKFVENNEKYLGLMSFFSFTDWINIAPTAASNRRLSDRLGKFGSEEHDVGGEPPIKKNQLRENDTIQYNDNYGESKKGWCDIVR